MQQAVWFLQSLQVVERADRTISLRLYIRQDVALRIGVVNHFLDIDPSAENTDFIPLFSAEGSV